MSKNEINGLVKGLELAGETKLAIKMLLIIKQAKANN